MGAAPGAGGPSACSCGPDPECGTDVDERMWRAPWPAEVSPQREVKGRPRALDPSPRIRFVQRAGFGPHMGPRGPRWVDGGETGTQVSRRGVEWAQLSGSGAGGPGCVAAVPHDPGLCGARLSPGVCLGEQRTGPPGDTAAVVRGLPGVAAVCLA